MNSYLNPRKGTTNLHTNISIQKHGFHTFPLVVVLLLLIIPCFALPNCPNERPKLVLFGLIPIRPCLATKNAFFLPKFPFIALWSLNSLLFAPQLPIIPLWHLMTFISCFDKLQIYPCLFPGFSDFTFCI